MVLGLRMLSPAGCRWLDKPRRRRLDEADSDSDTKRDGDLLPLT